MISPKLVGVKLLDIAGGNISMFFWRELVIRLKTLSLFLLALTCYAGSYQSTDFYDSASWEKSVQTLYPDSQIVTLTFPDGRFQSPLANIEIYTDYEGLHDDGPAQIVAGGIAITLGRYDDALVTFSKPVYGFAANFEMVQAISGFNFGGLQVPDVEHLQFVGGTGASQYAFDGFWGYVGNYTTSLKIFPGDISVFTEPQRSSPYGQSAFLDQVQLVVGTPEPATWITILGTIGVVGLFKLWRKLQKGYC